MKKIIILSGIPRSGTTWITDVIGLSSEINYVTGEPLNRYFSKKSFGLDNLRGRPYIPKNNTLLVKNLKNAFCLEWEFADFVRRTKFIVDEDPLNYRLYARLVKHFYFYLNSKPILLKDPALFFSMENVYKLLNSQNIIVSRNPLGFTSSMLRVGWSFSFEVLLRNKNLISDLLYPFKDEMLYFEKKDRKFDSLGRCILLWKLHHYVYVYWRKKYNDKWIFTRHENLASNPDVEFQKLFKKLNLKYTVPIARKIESYRQYLRSEPKEFEVHDKKRNSKSLVDNWKKYLDKHQVDRICNETADLTTILYPGFHVTE